MPFGLSPIFIFICSIPTILITLVFGFTPWGLATAIATPIVLTLAAGLFPKKNYIRIHMSMAVEGLSYGRLDDAKDHISIAIREAESNEDLDRLDVDDLCAACEKVAASLNAVGQTDVARSLREQCSKIAARFSQGGH